MTNRCAILCLLIAGSSSVFGQTAPDERAGTILKEVVKTYAAMRTISGNFVVWQQVPGTPKFKMNGTFRAQKPNRYMIDSEGAMPLRFVSDGKSVLTVIKPQNAYTQVPADDLAMSQTVTALPPLTIFFNQHKLVAPNTPTRYLGRETWNGEPCDKVEQKVGSTTMRYYISAKRLILRIVVHVEQGGQAMDVDAYLTKVRVDSAMTVSDFPVRPPRGAVMVEMPRPGGTPIAVGQTAPDFSLPQPSGGRIALSDAVKSHKAVLVTFWFCACATCREEFPQLIKLYGERKAQGLEIIAVDSFDDVASVRQFVADASLPFPIAMDDAGSEHFGIAKKYGVGSYPTTYLIGADGKVVGRFVGVKVDEIRTALDQMGLKAGDPPSGK